MKLIGSDTSETLFALISALPRKHDMGGVQSVCHAGMNTLGIPSHQSRNQPEKLHKIISWVLVTFPKRKYQSHRVRFCSLDCVASDRVKMRVHIFAGPYLVVREAYATCPPFFICCSAVGQLASGQSNMTI